MKLKKRVKKLILGVLALGILGAAGLGLWLALIFKSLPPPTLIENRRVAESTKIYDRSGEILLFEIHGEEKRTIIPFEAIPEVVKKTTLAAEDANFYNHPAFEWQSIARAFLVNLRGGQIIQGGSTITQQLAKKAFLTDERTLTRKIKELVLALELEKKFTKDQILEAYLNQIPYGANAYGIEAASQTFFNRPARDLDLAEAALLASLPKAPSYYSPWGQNTKALFSRRDYILENMAAAGWISEEEKNLALEKKLEFAKPSKGIKAPHLVMMVQDYLNKQYGEDFVRTRGLKVTTTLDWGLQQIAEEVISAGAAENEKSYQGKNAALVAHDASTGQILALVGSRDYFDTDNEGNFNVAAQGLRQPGSALKPFVYAAAFKKGYTPETILFDLETEFDTTAISENSYKPENYDGRFRGPIDIRHSLAQSINVPAVKTLYLVGLNDALALTRDFGLNTLTEKSRYGLSLVLGGGEVKLIDLVNAYAAFAQDGVGRKQSFILEISEKNKILESYQNEPREVIEPQYARLINDILSDTEARRPIFGFGLDLPSFPDHQIAIKTGTTDNYRDAWAIGYTPSLVVGVWAGNNDNQPMTKEGASFRAAVPIWKNFMNQALGKFKPEVFGKPDQITAAKPVLQGSHIVNYQSGSQILPQIHNILFYVDRRNPEGPAPINPQDDVQFENWEKPVLEWVQKNIPDYQTFNQPLPPDSVVVASNQNNASINKLEISLTAPANGSFYKDFINIDAQITSDSQIKKLELYINSALIDSKSNLSPNFRYQASFDLRNYDLQNLLKLVVTNDKDIRTEKGVIVFRNS